MTAVPKHGRGVILAALLLALFLGALDQTIVGTALPRIVTELGGSALYTWVITAYLLSSTIMVPIYGKFSDVFGRKPLLLIGVAVFLIGSALSGQSRNMAELITFRAIQGLGAGALFPLSLAIIGDLFTPRERGRYQGLFGAVFGISFIVGPVTGGLLTDHLSWRWIFYVNIPIGLVVLAVLATVLHNHRAIDARVRDLDFAGIAVFTAGVVPLLIGLSNKGTTDSNGVINTWTIFPVGGLIAIGVFFLVVFLFVEHRAKHPIVPLYLFRDRTIAASNLVVFLVSFGLFSSIIFVPRYYQVVQGISATESGYMVWPLLVGLIGSSVVGGIAITKTGKYKRMIVGAMVLVTVGGLLMTHLQTGTSNTMLWIWLAVLGFGVGPSMSAFTVIIQNVAHPKDLGVATSTMTFLRQIGGSVGLAIAGTIFNSALLTNIPVQLTAHQVPAAIVQYQTANQSTASNDFTGVESLTTELNRKINDEIAAVNSNVQAGRISTAVARTQIAQLHSTQQYVPNMVAGIHDSFSLAAGTVFWLIVVAGGMAFLASLMVPEVPLRAHHHAGAAEVADLIPGGEIVMDGDEEAGAV